MDTSPRGLETLDSKAFDEYIDGAIDQLFVPRRGAGAPAQTTPPADEAPVPGEGGDETDPLEVLQESLLSLDWEVSPKNIAEFEQRVRQIGQRHLDDRNVATVVQMVAAVCKYLVARGESANALGVQFPSAAVRTLELLLAEPATPLQDCRAAVARLHEKYKLLQAEARRRSEEAVQAPPREQSPESPPGREDESSPPPQAAPPPTAVSGDGEARGLSESESPQAIPASEDAECREAAEVEGDDGGGGEVFQVPAAGGGEGREDAPGEPMVEAPGGTVGEDQGESRGAPESPGYTVPAWLDSAGEAKSLCAEVLKRLDAIGSRSDAEGWPRNLEGDDDLGPSLDRLAEAARAVVDRVPPPPDGGYSAMGSDTLSILGGLVQAVGRIERHLGTALPPVPGVPRASLETAPIGGQGFTVSVGAEEVALADDTLVRSVEVSAKKAQAVRDRGYAMLSDVCGAFGSVRKGISGPLAGRSTADLKRLHFRLLEGCSETGQVVVFLSDGENHRALIADGVPSAATHREGGRALDLSA